MNDLQTNIFNKNATFFYISPCRPSFIQFLTILSQGYSFNQGVREFERRNLHIFVPKSSALAKHHHSSI
jgi:hypothetical protein